MNKSRRQVFNNGITCVRPEEDHFLTLENMILLLYGKNEFKAGYGILKSRWAYKFFINFLFVLFLYELFIFQLNECAFSRKVIIRIYMRVFFLRSTPINGNCEFISIKTVFY